MNPIFITAGAVYLLLINLLALGATVSDKQRAVKKKRRISESSLFLIALLGGTPLMYLTMRIIRHKTRHKNFMLGLPALLLAQLALLATFAIKYPIVFA